MGRITPPSEEPETSMPMAAARFLWNHVVAQVSDTLKMAPEPMALTSDCARNIW